MSYQHTWGGTIETKYFKISDCGLQGCPEECALHAPYCFKASAPFLTRKSGHISLVDPANLDVMGGAKASILTLSVDAMMTDLQWGWKLWDDRIKLIVDNANIFERSVDNIPWDNWKTYSWKVDKDITGAHRLDIDLYMDMDAGVGWGTLHNAKITLLGDVWTDEPPLKATVEFTVVNKDDGKPIKSARVTLMVGTKVLQDGYTDGKGFVSFSNMDEGSCIARVSASGYYTYEQGISIKAPMSIFTAELVPIPTAPIPSWVWWAVGGVVALGAIVTVPALVRRKEEKVIVVGK